MIKHLIRRWIGVAVVLAAGGAIVPGASSLASAARSPSARSLASAARSPSASGAPQVLRVGTYRGIPGQFNSIQAAVNAARPGDYILIAPGDYKTTSSRTPAGTGSQVPSAVLITTPRITLRGMNRNRVIVDGTRSGPPCNANRADQNFGPNAKGGPAGLNGIMIWKADDVSVQNLTACNFLGGSGDTGNEIWWNGGADSYKIGGWGYRGSYLTATSRFYENEATAARYGIFSSNWSGGTWDHAYTSNFNDSGFYIGACQQQCDQTIDHAWSEYSALGYSGTNSGGWLLIENSQFDNNEDGFDTNSQNADEPAPQNGACPAGVKPPVAGAPSCWVFTHNYVHDNNNPNVPSAGSAAAGPVGTGMSVSGGRNDTIMDNTFAHNNAWGVIFVPYLDSGGPCIGGTMNAIGPNSCLFDEWGDALLGNTFSANGSFGHPSNGDFAELNFEGGHPTDCASANHEVGGGAITASPSNLPPNCNGAPAPANPNPTFLAEVLCDSQVQLTPGVPAACPTGPYPRRTRVIMHPLPGGLQTMPDVCAGVPANPWCNGQVTRVRACVARSFRVPLTLAVRERFVRVTVRIGRSSRIYGAHGQLAQVRVSLGHLRRARVRFVELIRVRGRLERVTFTRVYRRC